MSNKRNYKLVNSSVRFNKIILRLIFSHSFFTITMFGNLIIVGFSFLMFFIEGPINPNVNSFMDALWWGFATATTVGYGDIIPVSVPGKIIGIALMMAGTALFATYTALFAQTVLEDDFFRLNIKLDDTHQDDFLKELKKHKDLIDKQISMYDKKGD